MSYFPRSTPLHRGQTGGIPKRRAFLDFPFFGDVIEERIRPAGLRLLLVMGVRRIDLQHERLWNVLMLVEAMNIVYRSIPLSKSKALAQQGGALPHRRRTRGSVRAGASGFQCTASKIRTG
ncbi:hypothetical protein PIB30_099535 [Stylosanthes scabra]|uniref:Uncharacterized protein n=1 Tax=Stylosanthes scabra TaxID=79078 RepID=A0ABU6QXQ9_9FABA|nr:hypothetical protein [Stylosanthes scabra]